VKEATMSGNEELLELIEWLKGEKYLIDEHSTTMTEEFEKEHKWELSRNRMINKTIKKIEEMIEKSKKPKMTEAEFWYKMGSYL
jgi:hypothetical protein